MEISSFAHARYKYPTCTQEKCKLLCNLCVLWTVADGTLVGEQLLHAPCWISNTAVLSSSACLLITPPPRLNQQFLTDDNDVVLATANPLENTTARFSISVANFHDYHASKFCSVAYTQSTVEGPQYSTPSLASNLNDTTFSRYKYKCFTHSILTRHLTTFEVRSTD